MANGNGINNRDKKTYKDRKKGKFSKQKKQNIYDAGVLPEFTVESDGTSYKSSDKPKKSFKSKLTQSTTQKPKKRLMVNRKLRKTYNRVVEDSLSENNNIASAAARASSEFVTEALGLAATNTTSNVTSHIEKANKALGEAIRTKKYDPAANEAVRRMKNMDKSPAMMYGKPSSPLKSGSPLAKYGCTGKH